MKDIQNKMCNDAKTKRQLIKTFKELNDGFTRRVTGKAVSRIAAKKLLNVALQMRKEHAGSLLRITITVQGIQICDKKYFGEGCQMASTEPYFYDAAYSPVKRNYAIPIDEYGKCTLAKLVFTDVKDGTKKLPMKWECTSECRSLTDCEVNAILSLKSSFDQSVRQALDTFDSDCPNEHYTKLVHDCTTELMGHPLVCYNGGGCLSKLRILRTGAVFCKHSYVSHTLL